MARPEKASRSRPVPRPCEEHRPKQEGIDATVGGLHTRQPD